MNAALRSSFALALALIQPARPALASGVAVTSIGDVQRSVKAGGRVVASFAALRKDSAFGRFLLGQIRSSDTVFSFVFGGGTTPAANHSNTESLEALTVQGCELRQRGGMQAPYQCVLRVIASGSTLNLVNAGGHVFLADRAWSDENPLVIADDFSSDAPAIGNCLNGRAASNDHFWCRKDQAGLGEARMVVSRQGDTLLVSTPRISTGALAFGAILARARLGDHVKVLLDDRFYARRSAESGAIAQLREVGVAVRSSDHVPTLAVDGTNAWVGSASMTTDEPFSIEWGFATSDGAFAGSLRNRFQAAWNLSHGMSV